MSVSECACVCVRVCVSASERVPVYVHVQFSSQVAECVILDECECVFSICENVKSTILFFFSETHMQYSYNSLLLSAYFASSSVSCFLHMREARRTISI